MLLGEMNDLLVRIREMPPYWQKRAIKALFDSVVVENLDWQQEGTPNPEEL